MKAAVYYNYGGPEVLRVENVERPYPKDNEVLVRVFASAVNSGDWRLRKADPFAVRFFFGLRRPKRPILGGVFSGVVEQAGKSVKTLKVGDEVFGKTGMKFGAYAEYLCFREEESIAVKPTGLSFEQAAVIPFGATTALHFLKRAAIRPGQKVLVYGASGAVGSAAVQLAKYYGAKVTAVCGTSNIELVKSLGADDVLDYTKQDIKGLSRKFDLVYETVNKLPLVHALDLVRPGGLVLLNAAGPAEMFKGMLVNLFGSKKVRSGVISHRKQDLVFLKDLADQGLLKPVIDRTYPLAEISAAHAYAENGHKKGNVAITV